VKRGALVRDLGGAAGAAGAVERGGDRGLRDRRAGAGIGGLADSTIRNDTGHLDLIREWFGRPLWEVQPTDADIYFGRVLRVMT
jgi:hypothetical protein